MPSLNPGDKVLVTGGTGFIGRFLCEHLHRRGLRVRVLSRRPAPGPWQEHIAADVGAGPPPAAALDGVACVFHLAGYAHAMTRRGADTEAHRRINLDGTRHVLLAARSAAVRALVFASSVKAMGEGTVTPADESTRAEPVSAYGRAKRDAEALVLAAHGRGLHASVLRLPLVYGPGVGGNLARLLGLIRAGVLPGLSLPDNARSMVDARDVAAALVLLAESDAAGGRSWLVTDGEDYSTQRIVQAMRRALGHGTPRVRIPWPALRLLAAGGDAAGALLRRRMPFDSAALQALAGSARYDAGRIRRELGFTPRWTLEHALPDMCRECD